MFWPLHLCSELKHPVTSCVNYQLHHKSLFQTKIFLVTPFFGSPAATFCSKKRFLAGSPPLHLSNLRYNHIFFNKIQPLSMRNNLGVKKKGDLSICGQNWPNKVEKIEFWLLHLSYTYWICVTPTFFPVKTCLYLWEVTLEQKKIVTFAFVAEIDWIKWKKSIFGCFTSVTPIKSALHPHFFASNYASTYEK